MVLDCILGLIQFLLVSLFENVREALLECTVVQTQMPPLHSQPVDFIEYFLLLTNSKVLAHFDIVGIGQILALLANGIECHLVTLHDVLLAIEVEDFRKPLLLELCNVHYLPLSRDL